jgi:brefeldin A-inhibited guanine nucleotide-exchange protein
LLVDLFLNYDCDIGSFNTFQKIAEVLEKTAHARRGALGEDGPDASGGDTSASGDGSGTSEEQKLKTLALEALVAAMSSLAHWTTRIVKPNAQTMLEAIEHADGEQPMGAGRSTALAAIGAAAAAAAMKSGESSSNSGDDSSRARSGSSTVGEDGSAIASPSPPPHPSSSPALPFSSLSTGAQMASSFSTQFQLLRAQKQKLDSGIAKFNAKPKVGLAYLQQHGLLAEDPVSIARFFHSNTALDKVQLGDYMGDEHAFNKAVLYAYVEQMDFSGLSFDESIREFLQGFRLPGEAQKIDRMMEKFAEQYHKNNPGRFHSADTAYVLAYSIIMLNTDAHNAGVKVRMTKQDFFKSKNEHTHESTRLGDTLGMRHVAPPQC